MKALAQGVDKFLKDRDENEHQNGIGGLHLIWMQLSKRTLNSC